MSTSLADWLRMLDTASFDVDGASVVCWFRGKGVGRRHTVRVSEAPDAIRFEATVVGAAALGQIEGDHHRAAWRHNRATSLVGVRVDLRGRLVAEAVAPLVGLTAEEFTVYLRAVASEADRLELILTGRDVQ